MLHHYQNYSHSLSRLLGYHQFEGSTTNENEPMPTFCGEDSSQEDSRGRTVTNKSFTIASILGLKGSEDQNLCPLPTDLSVNLSVHSNKHFDITDHQVLNCSRLQLPMPHHSTLGTEHHFSLGPHQTCQSTKQNVRGVKHLSSSILQNSKKNSKSKRVRTIFTPEQLERLEAEFERQQYMVGPERLYLAHTLQLTEAQVKVWFQNRRIKWRKHHLELTHQRLAVLKQQQMLLEEPQPDVQDTSSSSTDNTS